MQNGGSVQSYLRFPKGKTMVFLWFSSSFPVFLWFSYGVSSENLPNQRREDAVDLVSHGVGSVVDAVDYVWGSWAMEDVDRKVRQHESGCKYQGWGCIHYNMHIHNIYI